MKRESIGIGLLVLIFGITIATAWGFLGGSAGREKMEDESGPLFASMEYRLLRIQGEVLVGAKQFISGAGKTLIGPEVGAEQLRRAFQAVFMTRGEQKTSVRMGAIRRGLILARFFGFSDDEKKLTEELSQIVKQEESSPDDLQANDLVLRALKKEASPGDWAELRVHLPWYGTLLFLATQAEELTTDRPKFLQKAEDRFVRVMLGLCVVAALFVLSALLAIVFAVLLFGKTLRSRFSPGGMPPYLSLEVFVLYMASLLGISKALAVFSERFGLTHEMLGINAAIIPAMLVFLLWPMLWRRPWREIRLAFGLTPGGIRQIVLDVFAGPLAYIAAMVPLLLVLSLYSWVLMKSGIDITKGAHPLVPILIFNSSSGTKILVALLASIIAPIVEEIMFRGAFYTWLRSHFSARISILTSAILFAAIHPQGPIGIVPLAFIGIVLASLREWRQSLVAPILAHACFNSGTLLFLILVFGGES